MSLRRQRGALGAVIVVVLVLLLGVGLANYVLRRISDSSENATQGAARLAAAADAIEAFAAAQRRLPCPAQPDLDTGLEVPTAVGAATCTYPEGTIPWQTIGLKREDGLDPWGRKISYRVYTAASGSLVQPNGVSMVECDTVEPAPGPVTAAGLCNPGSNITERNTMPAQFLAGKGLQVKDMAADITDAAYVLVSHGATGLGGYSSSGTRLDMPSGDERKNTLATGDFTIKAASEPDVGATSGQHFDDLLLYRRLPELVRRIRLEGRDWLDMGTTSLRFDAATVSAAVGSPVSPGSTGRVTINFLGAVASGLANGSTATEITYDTGGVVGGIGVGGGGSNLIQSSANESVRFVFTNGARRFGVTLAHFGYYGSVHVERADVRFFLGETQLAVTGSAFGCLADGGYTSFTVSPDQLFDRVEIAAIPTYHYTPPNLTPEVPPAGISAFLVAEVKACDSTATECVTSLDTGPWIPPSGGGNRCPFL